MVNLIIGFTIFVIPIIFFQCGAELIGRVILTPTLNFLNNNSDTQILLRWNKLEFDGVVPGELLCALELKEVCTLR